MADSESIPMHSDFPRWYQEIDIGQHPDLWQRRWAGVASLAENATRADVEVMIRLIFRLKRAQEEEAVSRIRQHFKTADGAFEMAGNARELEILCGAALVACFSGNTDSAAGAALATTTAALAGARQASLPMDIVVLAEEAITRLSGLTRARPELTILQSPDPAKLNFDRSAAKARENTWEAVAGGFTLAAESTRGYLNDLTRAQNEAATRIHGFLAIQDEELQMLWWLVGERSWDLKCPFDRIPVAARPTVLAKELADMTVSMPGVRSIQSLFARAGLKDTRATTVPGAVNATPQTWPPTLSRNAERFPASIPIHFAMARRLETGDDATWIPGWAAATEVDAAHKISPHTFGVLFYRERLLDRFWSQ